MEAYYRVKEVCGLLGCGPDTARAWMAEMPGVINVGNERRRQLMVPQSGIESWLANRRMQAVRLPAKPVPVKALPQRMLKGKKSGGMARMNRRTGKLEAG